MSSEVEEPFETPAARTPQEPPEGRHETFAVPDDISGIDNLLEEGGPLEPQDVAEVEEPGGRHETDPLTEALQQAAERTADLQRLHAEYANYRKRVDRDRDLIKENATFAALLPVIEVLDSIDRAREAGELEGGFKTVADQLERVVAGAGLTRFGAPGDAFDPTLHEALSHLGTDPDVTVATAKFVAKAGYRMGDRVVRAAQVIVVDPEVEESEVPGRSSAAEGGVSRPSHETPGAE